jgi:FkbM family methyltransferase
LKFIKNLLLANPSILFLMLVFYSYFFGINLTRAANDKIALTRNGNRIEISKSHLVYLRDIIPYFDFYFNASDPSINPKGLLVVDYSEPKLHSVKGYDFGRLWIPSLPDPIETSEIYIKLTRPKAGMTVLDLGSYGGLTAISFKSSVGTSGRVVSVEADPINLECAKKNLASYEQQTGLGIDLLHAAVWNEEGTIQFVAESGLGSAVAHVLSRSSAQKTLSVPAMTLSSIADRFSLSKIDIIKADIEGAELEAFSDAEFFRKNRPVIVFESYGKQLREIESLLENYGYTCTKHKQVGARLPLVLCKPNEKGS